MCRRAVVAKKKIEGTNVTDYSKKATDIDIARKRRLFQLRIMGPCSLSYKIGCDADANP